MLFYDEYAAKTAEGATFLCDLGDYDILEAPENVLVKLWHENIADWQRAARLKDKQALAFTPAEMANIKELLQEFEGASESDEKASTQDYLESTYFLF